VYAAPGGIVHYVSDHSYRPPAAFLDAVASCPGCVSEQYLEAIRRANGGVEPPMRTFEEVCRAARAYGAFTHALGIPLMQATRAQVVAAARKIWPEASFSDEAESIKLGDITVTFDRIGRVLDAS